MFNNYSTKFNILEDKSQNLKNRKNKYHMTTGSQTSVEQLIS